MVKERVKAHSYPELDLYTQIHFIRISSSESLRISFLPFFTYEVKTFNCRDKTCFIWMEIMLSSELIDEKLVRQKDIDEGYLGSHPDARAPVTLATNL